MVKPIKILIILIVISLITACNNPPKLNNPEKNYGTGGNDLSTFHKIAENDLGLSLRFPGYIVGVEKSYKKALGFNGKQLFPPFCFYDDIDNIKVTDFNSTDNFERVKGYLNDCKRSYVSHIRHYFLDNSGNNVAYIKEDTSSIPTLYDKNFIPSKDYPAIYKKSFESLELLKSQITQDILRVKQANKPYTHIFLFAMGWNTDQQESFRNFNSLMTQLIENKAEGKTFNPLFIGISWPSEWTWHLFEGVGKAISYPTKADDADEVGYLWGNYVLRKILVPLKHENNIPLIVIGHSFGARLLSRAVFSLPLSEQKPNPSDVDLFVGLQGAFSTNRFIKNGGNEGYPYENFKNYARKFMFTWSKHDSATPLALYFTGAPHIGGSAGYEITKDSSIFQQFKVIVKPETDSHYDYIFDHVDNADAWQASFKSRDKISIIDASDLIFNHPYNKGGNAHSDIYSPGVAKLIWSALENL